MIGLQIENGDLQIGATGFATVSGAAKVFQDLSIATLEPYGCDRFHPKWGSLLYNHVGDAITPVVSTLVESEVARLINNYVLVQQDAISSRVAQGLASQFSTDEVVSSIESINVTQHQDFLTVAVTVKTVSGQSVALTSQVNP